MLSKISDLVPFLKKYQISLKVKDLKTGKVHFQQVTKYISKINEIDELMKSMEQQPFFLGNLECNPAQLFIGDIVISMFKIKNDQNTMFVLSKEKVTQKDLPQFIKSVISIKKRIQSMY